jgi:hypothetical protein
MRKEGLVCSLKKQCPEVGECVDKWYPKIEAVVNELSKITKQDSDDVLQDILLAVWSSVEWYKVPRVRYKKHLWEIKGKEEDKLLLIRTFKGKPVSDTALESEVEIPTQTSLSSFVYRSIWEHFLNSIGKHFSQKNGYFKIGESKKVVKNKWDGEVKEVVIPVYEYKGGLSENQEFDDKSYSLLDFAADSSFTPEQSCQFVTDVDFVLSSVSGEAKNLFFSMLEGQEVKPSTVANQLKKEIVGSLPSRFLRYKQVRDFLQ